jgi:uncharacterized protein YbaP (TraB family)
MFVPRLAVAALLLAASAVAPARAGADADCPAPPAAPTAGQLAAEQRSARDRGFLWRLHKDGVTSFLYGTVHVARREWLVPGPTVRAALRAAETLALELDPLDATVQRAMAEAGAARAAAIALPAPLRARLAARLRAECLPETALDTHGPEMRIALLTLIAARRDGLEAAYGIDLVLAGVARGRPMPVVSLETPPEQLRALQMPTADGALALLDAGLLELESGRARPMLVRMAQVWADADFATLARYDDWCDCRRTAGDAALMRRLLDDRNPLLAARIAALHAPGRPVFAAVGSLHMIGPTGLPALLAAQGFAVERVAFAAKETTAVDIRALWNFDDLPASEAALRAALAGAGRDDTLALQTQIARTYSLRSRFDDAHAVLDRIEPELATAGPEPNVRYLLERGRTWRSAKQPEKARPLFLQAVDVADAAGLEDLAIDAMHMVALVEPAAQQLAWNERALAAARRARDPAARAWQASLANNIGMALHGRGRYEEALASFRTALAERERMGKPASIRVAHWMIAWTQRALKRHDEALAILLRLEREGAAAGAPDGHVFEEIGENLLALGRAGEAKPWFAKAHAQHRLDTSLNRPDDTHLARLLELSR